jgi:hypothetical protein
MSEGKTIWEAAADGDPTAQELVAFMQGQDTEASRALRDLVAECANSIISEAQAAGQEPPDAGDLAQQAWRRAAALRAKWSESPWETTPIERAWLQGFRAGLRENPGPHRDEDERDRA